MSAFLSATQLMVSINGVDDDVVGIGRELAGNIRQNRRCKLLRIRCFFDLCCCVLVGLLSARLIKEA